jgi:hypothetical protein
MLTAGLSRYRRLFGSRQAPAFATAAVIAVGFVLSMAATLPGELSYDSVIQLFEGRTATYSGWHPPVMSWLLGLADVGWPGTGLYVFAGALVMFSAVASLGWLVRGPSWLGMPVATLCIVLPQFAIYQGIVWKDVLFADASVVGFVLLAHAAAHWRNVRARIPLLALCAMLLVLAALARQNGGTVLLAAAAAIAFLVRRYSARRRYALLMGIAFLSVTIVVTLGATALLNKRVADPANVARQVRLLQLYDLAGAFAADPALQLPQLKQMQPKLLALIQTDASRLYSPAKSDTLVGSARLQKALAASPTNVLQPSWMQLVVHDTGLYLRDRAEIFRWTFLTPDIARCVPYIVGQRGPAAVMQALAMPSKVTPRDHLVDRYGKWLMNTPFFSHALFFVLALLELSFLAFRRSDTDVVFVCLLFGTIAFCATFFFLAIACDYRYLYPLDVSALVVAIYIALSARAPEARVASEAGA